VLNQTTTAEQESGALQDYMLFEGKKQEEFGSGLLGRGTHWSKKFMLTSVFKPAPTIFSISFVTLTREHWMNGSYAEIAFIDRSETSWATSPSSDSFKLS